MTIVMSITLQLFGVFKAAECIILFLIIFHSDMFVVLNNQ